MWLFSSSACGDPKTRPLSTPRPPSKKRRNSPRTSGARKVVASSPVEYAPYSPALHCASETRVPLAAANAHSRSEEHTSELQSLMRNSYAVFCLQKKNKDQKLQL